MRCLVEAPADRRRRRDKMQHNKPARKDERQPAKIPSEVWDKFKALLERGEVEFASLRVVASSSLGSGSAGGGG